MVKSALELIHRRRTILMCTRTRHHKSISIWSFYGEWSLEEKIQLASEAGFDGFEIDLTEAGEVNLRSSPEALEKIRALS